MDHGEFYRIRKMNRQTKRMNQTLKCKYCLMEFPKLCNLRDHLRIHRNEMPYSCRMCDKGFTQAGNRDRHERRRICQTQEVEDIEMPQSFFC
mmetsp:Transcript_4008/g.6784  ORF Transcript_4008/g.6784 Transcript_4008/m.6784 type:complete len:92 (-) Transcript_4008:97-372(-)